MGGGTGVAVGVCVYLIWTGGGTLPCLAVGAGALMQDASSIAATNARNAAYDELQKAKKAYKDCVKSHKHYYGE